jgi:hypothetical protein
MDRGRRTIYHPAAAATCLEEGKQTEKSKISADKRSLKRDYLCIYRKEDKGIIVTGDLCENYRNVYTACIECFGAMHIGHLPHMHGLCVFFPLFF